MNESMERFNQVIEYIETHLKTEIHCSELAKIALVSEYEFRRIFSFLVGIPVAEYIRKRRLSLAVEELKTGNASVTEIGSRYGYDSPSSFTRAFKDAFGVSPQEAKSAQVKVPIFIKFRFTLFVEGGTAMPYTEETHGAFFVSGICGESALDDTCCCESVWEQYEQNESIDKNDDIYAAYVNGQENVICYIGNKMSFAQNEPSIYVRSGKWIVFEAQTDASEKEVNDLYEKIMFSFLPSGIYERDNDRPNIEIFPKNGDIFKIMIPVRLRKEKKE